MYSPRGRLSGRNPVDAEGAILRAVDERGKRYGSLLVLTRAPSKSGGAKWHCKCLCGEATVVRADNLRSGRTTTCGCAGRAKDSPEFDMKTPPKRPRPNRTTVVTVKQLVTPPPPGPVDWRPISRRQEVLDFLERHPECVDALTYCDIVDELGI
jgi:hypothetical protein